MHSKSLVILFHKLVVAKLPQGALAHCSLHCRYSMQQSCPLHAYALYCLLIRDRNSEIVQKVYVLANTVPMRCAMHLVCTHPETSRDSTHLLAHPPRIGAQ